MRKALYIIKLVYKSERDSKERHSAQKKTCPPSQVLALIEILFITHLMCKNPSGLSPD